jgi:DNA invertase Pin-like site-specific DNA recombinase
MSNIKINPLEYTKIVKMYQDGIPVSKISSEYKVCYQTIYSILSKNNIQLSNVYENKFIENSREYSIFFKMEMNRHKILIMI